MKKFFINFLAIVMVMTISSTAFGQETDVVKSNQSAISKELKADLEGNDPDKEILMQPGNSAPLPNWLKNLPNSRNHSLFGVSPESTGSFVSQLLHMSENAYNNNESIGSWSPGSWQLYKKYTNPQTSFTVYVYRQHYIEETDTGKYAYAFAFRGTADNKDILEDALQVVGNVKGLQASDAVDYVRTIMNSDRSLIHHVHFTGHSLGGYLASWVQSEMVDGVLPLGPSYTITFNAPGLSPNVIPLGNTFDIQKAKVLSKIYNDKLYKYDPYIDNYRIAYDAVSAFGDDLGNVYTYNAISSGNPLYYHKLDRFWELNL